MHRLLSILLITAVACTFLGCKGRKHKNEQLGQSNNFYLSISKTPCHGTCPIYKMTLVEDGNLTLNAIRFMSLEGLYTGQLNQQALDSIKMDLIAVEWKSLEEEYMTGYADLPSTEITYSDSPGDTTFVRWESQRAPLAVLRLGEELERIQKNQDWKKVSPAN